MQAIQILSQLSQRLEPSMTALNVCRWASVSGVGLCALEFYKTREKAQEARVHPMARQLRIGRFVPVASSLAMLVLTSSLYRFHPALAALPVLQYLVHSYLVLWKYGEPSAGQPEPESGILMWQLGLLAPAAGCAFSAYTVGQWVTELTARARKVLSQGSGLAVSGASLFLFYFYASRRFLPAIKELRSFETELKEKSTRQSDRHVAATPQGDDLLLEQIAKESMNPLKNLHLISLEGLRNLCTWAALEIQDRQRQEQGTRTRQRSKSI
jgi:hypothetical protein